VPAGKVSFEAILHKNGMMGRGRALLACDGFVDPRWVAGEFHADSADTFSFHWCAAFGGRIPPMLALVLANCERVRKYHVQLSRREDAWIRTDDQFVIYFHRYDPDTEKPVMDEEGKAITNTYLYEGRPRAD
jgi:hypothetical protein